MNQIATYKGRKYRLAWRGETKYGPRAKLQFLDGGKEFWVASDAIQVTATGDRTNPLKRTRKGGFHPAYDSGCWDCRAARRSGAPACERCLFDGA